MQKEENVKPCPRCEIDMKIKCSTIKDGHGNILDFYSIFCHRCGYGLMNSYFTAEEAIAHWNSETLSNYLPQEPPSEVRYCA